jgi:hypothetical protein
VALTVNIAAIRAKAQTTRLRANLDVVDCSGVTVGALFWIATACSW